MASEGHFGQWKLRGPTSNIVIMMSFIHKSS